jgi:hypothetical protein
MCGLSANRGQREAGLNHSTQKSPPPAHPGGGFSFAMVNIAQPRGDAGSIILIGGARMAPPHDMSTTCPACGYRRRGFSLGARG